MEYTVAESPERILGLTRSFLQSPEWPWVNQTGIYGGIVVKEDC